MVSIVFMDIQILSLRMFILYPLLRFKICVQKNNLKSSWFFSSYSI